MNTGDAAAKASAEPGRRSLLVMLASFAALTALVAGGSVAARALHMDLARSTSPRASSRPAPPPPPSPEIVAFLGPLAAGERFGSWRVARVEPTPPGHMTLELEDGSGARFVVDLYARDAAGPAGLAETPRVAIYARTAPGEPTPPAAVEACTALAAAVRAREDAGHQPPPLVSLPQRR